MDTGGITTRLSPDGFQTAIDGVAYERYERDGQPAYLNARDGMFFKQESMDAIAHIWDEYSGVPNIEETDEQEEVTTIDVFLGNQKTQRVKVYKNDYPISWEAFKTDKGFLRARLATDIADASRRLQDYASVIDCYGDAFDGNNFTTPDGSSLANSSHTTLRGDNVDNLETGDLTPDNLYTLVNSLESMIGQHGEFGGNVFAGILVPQNLYKTVKEVMNSKLLANSAENNLNIFETDYGFVNIKQSALLRSKFNAGSNANTGYHIISENHHITRRTLAGMELTLLEPKFTKNDSYAERVRLAEITYPETHYGYAASAGTTA